MSTELQQLLRTLPRNRRYLIGISGGRDSVALLHWLIAHGYRRLIVCHLNHRLRGRAAAADANFVRRLADAHGLEFEGAETDVRAFAKQHRQSIETAARTARYAFFVDVARRRRCRTIFLGHHADDLVETFLFNLFRGSSGARSIKPVVAYTIGKTKLTVVRPLLTVWREEIDTYVREHRLEFRDDATNEMLAAVRNRMRREIIPHIEQRFGRGVRKSLWRAAMIAAEEDALVAQLTPAAADRLSTKQLLALQPALQRRVIFKWLRDHGVPDVGFDLVEQVRSLAGPQSGTAKVNLPGARHARRREGHVFIE